MQTKIYKGIGLMSGSSLDGLDIAYCSFWRDIHNTWQFSLDAQQTIPYSQEWIERLAKQPASGIAYARLHIDYGHYLGLLLRQFLVEYQIQPDYVAAHGHTIFHQPEYHFTAQIGSGETMITYLNCPLVTDLRSRDMALGGQGAPLVPFGEKHLFYPIKLFLNLGGIANLSIIPDGSENFEIVSWKRGKVEHIAYDICGCNIVLNHLARLHNPTLQFDPNGSLAATGNLEPAILANLAQESYYHLIPPKSLGKEWVIENVIDKLAQMNFSIEDKLHTYTYFIANRLLDELDRFGVKNEHILITGGGAHNHFLVQTLKDLLTKRNITFIETEPNTVDYKEAIIFAFLGLMALLREPNVLKDATGASKAGICGAIHLPQIPGKYSIL